MLAALGGAFLVLMSLKVRGLTGLRAAPLNEFRWGVFALALVVGAVTGVVGHLVFGVFGAPLVSRFGHRCEARDLRTIWAVAGFPVAIGFCVLVILDVLIGGREAYSSLEDDALITGWAAGSLALGVSLAIWSLYLFAKGLGVAAGLGVPRRIMVMLVAAVCLVIAAPIAFYVLVGVGTLAGLLVDVVQAVKK